MFNTVLLTVDLTAEASWTKALPQAVELVKASGGELHVMSVVPDFGSPLVEGFFPQDFEAKALAKAEVALENLIENNVPEGVKVTPHLAYGDMHHKVLDAIKATNCDLVVMASHAPDRVREFLVGSNADRVVRRSPVSVLVVRG